MSLKRELRELQKWAEDNGWSITVTGGGHLRWDPPNGGRPVFTAYSPSDYRSVLNARQRLRRAGLPREDGRKVKGRKR